LVYTMLIYNLCKTLDSERVDYAIVGGYAVALHGAVRGTIDIDIVISLTRASYTKLEGAFHRMGLESRLPVRAIDVYNFRDEYIKKRNLIAWSFFNPKRPIDVVDVIITEDRRKFKVDQIRSNGTLLKVASIKDLILMKSKSDRPQDQEDIQALKTILMRKISLKKGEDL
jgi:hypothetical protein